MTEQALQALGNMSELDFTLKRVKPLFEGLNYRGVTYVGGANPPERGRDIVFYEMDEKLLRRRDIGAQVKKGDASAGTAAKLLDQINEAFRHPHRDPETGEERRICHLFIVVSGKILDAFVERVKVERPTFFPFITFWSGEQVLQHERSIASSSTRVTTAERQIHILGLGKMFEDEGFVKTVGGFVEEMFEKKNLSELRVVAELPTFLLGLENIKERISFLTVPEQREVLHCLSIMIVTKSNLNYGAEGSYGIGSLKRTRT